MNKIIFVGSQYLGHQPDDGETMKNQVLSRSFERLGLTVVRIDVRNRWQRLFFLVKYVFCLLFARKAKLVFSASSFVAYPLLRVAKILGWKGQDIYYWVIGGNFANYVAEGKINPKLYYDLRKIIVEGASMRLKLEQMSFSNVMVLPNIKDIPDLPYIAERTRKAQTRFVFLSRVMPQKGVNYIFDAASRLVKSGHNDFVVDVYGRIAPEYKEVFEREIRENANVDYKGFLMLDSIQGYIILSSYDAMLFPTYWKGEGFPGIIIDAFVAGLPVIATDWNLNSSLIKNNENGLVIPAHDVGALADAMRKIIGRDVDLDGLSDNAHASAKKYDASKVITHTLLKDLSIIQ